MDDDNEDADSSEQRSTYMDSDGNLLNPESYNGDMSSLDEIDCKILTGAIWGVDLAEVYSPERIIKVCKKVSSRMRVLFPKRLGLPPS